MNAQVEYTTISGRRYAIVRASEGPWEAVLTGWVIAVLVGGLGAPGLPQALPDGLVCGREPGVYIYAEGA